MPRLDQPHTRLPGNADQQQFGPIFRQIIEYEPEMFPGLVFRVIDPKIVFLLFATGNILTGGKNLIGVKRGLDGQTRQFYQHPPFLV